MTENSYTTDCVLTRTLEGRISDWNRGAHDLYGWRKEDAIGKVSHELLQTRFPKPLTEINSEVVEKGRWQGKLVHVTRAGGQVVVESRWILERTAGAAVLVEINRRSGEADLESRRQTVDRSGAGTQDPLPPLKSTNSYDRLARAADIFLVAGGTVSVLALLYLLYYYSISGQRSFSSPGGMILYYGLPLAMAVLFFGSLRKLPTFRIGIALTVVSTSLALYCFELFLFFTSAMTLDPRETLLIPPRTAVEEQEIVTVAKSFGVDFDMRSELEVVNDLRSQGVDAFPAVVPLGLLSFKGTVDMKSPIQIHGNEVLPLAGISNRVTVLCNELGEYLTYVSDEYGFHNPEGIWHSAPLEVAAIGDSYVHGICVPSDKNFVALVRQRYPATVNLGIGGNGPLLELATLIEYARTLKPRAVLWFFYEGNDLQNLQQEAKVSSLTRYLQSGYSQGLLSLQPDIDASLVAHVEPIGQRLLEEIQRSREREERGLDARALIRTARDIAVAGSLRQRLGLMYGSTPEDQKSATSSEQMNLLRTILLQAKSVVSEWGGTLHFIYLPQRERYAYSDIANKADVIREQVLSVARSAGLPVIDIHNVFVAHGDPLSLFPFRRLGHYNEKGNQLVAEEVLRSVSPNDPNGRQ